MTVTIRAIKDSDIPILWKLEENMWTNDNTPNANQQLSFDAYEKSQKDREILVAVNDDNLLGFISYQNPTAMSSHSRQWELGIGVAKKAQGQGIGKKLIAAVIEKARQQNIGKLSLRVMDSNPRARKFYEALGFVREAHYKNEFWINNHWVDDYHYAYYLEDTL